MKINLVVTFSNTAPFLDLLLDDPCLLNGSR